MRIPSLVLQATLFSAFVAGCQSETTEIEEPTRNMPSDVDITLYSPAPPQIMLHEQNVEIGKIIEACPGVGSVTTIPMALPESINTINSVDPAERPYHLPIVTTLDFVTARDGTAPDWHGYDRANPDLLFVASLYDVAFGVLTFDPDIQNAEDLRGRNIGVPPRPSAVRWMSEALFGDGWDILDEVNFVPLVPPQLAGALDAGDIDVMTWNIMSETPEGFLPMIPPLMNRPNAHWIDIDAEAVTRLNAARPFAVERITLGTAPVLPAPGPTPTNAGFMSFKQGLAAWENTPEPLVRAIKSCLQDSQSEFGAGVDFETKALSWPGLDNDFIHPGAR